MTTLWLIRHGQTDWNVQGLYQGRIDIPLNTSGLQQAQDLADRLALERYDFAAAYSSPLRRAHQTAMIVSGRLGLPVQVEDRLTEICHGVWEGRRRVEIEEQYNQTLNSSADSLNERAPGGESTLEVAQRMAAAASAIARADPQGNVLVFSHGFSLATLYCQAQHISLEMVYDHIPNNAAPMVINWTSGS